MNKRALLQQARSCIDPRGMSSPEYESLCKCTLAMIDEALAVPEQGREEWLKEAYSSACEVEELAGIVAHELSTPVDLLKLCAARNKLHAYIRAVPAPSGSPKAWMRKWAFDGVKPAKIKGTNGRWRWPDEMKFLPVTAARVFPDDVPLFAMIAASQTGAQE